MGAHIVGESEFVTFNNDAMSITLLGFAGRELWFLDWRRLLFFLLTYCS
jgi:hypothetical protein